MEEYAPCFGRLQVVRDAVPHSGAFNMALDEVLLGSLTGEVLLRFYRWAQPTVSCGYFETSLSAQSVAQGREIVRRWTGGGIVEHGEDLTYSLCVPRSCSFGGLRSTESYRRIHACVARALDRCGLRAASQDGFGSISPRAPRANACFEHPVLHDLLAGGRKIAGGAQRRNRVGLLHQGSIRVDPVDTGVGVAWKGGMWRELPAALADVCEDRPLAPLEIEQANALAAAKYATWAWTNRF